MLNFFPEIVYLILQSVMGKPQDDSDNPHSDASKLLEAALQQMDGIISGISFIICYDDRDILLPLQNYL